MSEFTWGTVTQLSPLRVRLDGDAAALPLTPDCLVDPRDMLVGDRVRCELSGHRLIVLGHVDGRVRAGTDTLAGLLELATAVEARAGTDTSRAVTPAALRAALVPLQGQIPSSVVVGSGSATIGADGTVSFTGCSSVSLMNVFDGLGNDEYKIFTEITGISVSSTAYLRLRTAAGADATGTVYNYSAIVKTDWNTSAPSGSGLTAQTIFGYIMPSAATTGNFVHAFSEHTIIRPAKAAVTHLVGWAQERTTSQTWWQEASDMTSPTAYTSLSLLGGTFTGTMKVVKIA